MAIFLMLLNIMIFLPSLVVCFVGMQYDESLPITTFNISYNAKKHVYRATRRL